MVILHSHWWDHRPQQSSLLQSGVHWSLESGAKFLAITEPLQYLKVSSFFGPMIVSLEHGSVTWHWTSHDYAVLVLHRTLTVCHLLALFPEERLFLWESESRLTDTGSAWQARLSLFWCCWSMPCCSPVWFCHAIQQNLLDCCSKAPLTVSHKQELL